MSFNYSKDCYESEYVCERERQPWDSSTAERSFDQPKATWKEKSWIILGWAEALEMHMHKTLPMALLVSEK